ncbi:MAG: DUF4389 domain-containing protein [Acidiferrobacterales bacterium]|nr:DUF4389 domain-containing protein [Acidiferrobacterales bacterium]
MANDYEGKSGLVRVLFVVLFWVVFYFTQLVIAVVAVGQCGFVLITNKPNQNLTQLGDSLSKYVTEILRYVTFNTDQRPFPFADFPKSDLAIS